MITDTTNNFTIVFIHIGFFNLKTIVFFSKPVSNTFHLITVDKLSLKIGCEVPADIKSTNQKLLPIQHLK